MMGGNGDEVRGSGVEKMRNKQTGITEKRTDKEMRD